MSTEEVAWKLVEFCRKGEWLEAVGTLYADDIVSVEAQPLGDMPAEMRGLEAVRGKAKWFMETSEIHMCTVSDPFVARDTFAVRYDLDVTDKVSKMRAPMSEVAIYKVRDGKVVREEFLPVAEKKS